VESNRLAAGKPASTAAPKRKKVLVVGILEERKHPELAIQAAALLDDNVDMVFCGDGPMEAELRQLAKSVGREQQVQFEGWTEDVSPYFEQADCLLFLSEREGLPMTVAEAMASGLAVVAFDIRGVRDLLHGLNGWHIPEARTAEAVAIAVRAALDTSIDKEAYRCKASQFTLEASLAAHDAAVQRLLQSQQCLHPC
jgi:glycosyltransferase involved in cell wall biosynthesis